MEFHGTLDFLRTLEFMRPPDELIEGRLRTALKEAAIDAVVDAGVLRVKRATFQLVSRTAQPWADRLLEMLSLHALRRRRGQDPSTTLVISVPRLVRTFQSVVIDALRELLRNGPLGNWIVISERGGVVFHLEDVDLEWSQGDDSDGGADLAAAPIAHQRDPLRRDITLTVLKVLLARASRSRRHIRWFADVLGALEAESIPALADKLKFATSSLYAVIGELRERHLVDVSRGGMPHLTDIPGVLAWWLDGQRHQSANRVLVKPIYDSPNRTHTGFLEWISRRPASGFDWAINGWSACQLHRALAITDAGQKPCSIIVNAPARTFLLEWKLRTVPRSQAAEAFFLLETTSMPVSTFCGFGLINGRPVVDLWQAALDVARDPQRGREQAEAIAQELWLA